MLPVQNSLTKLAAEKLTRREREARLGLRFFFGLFPISWMWKLVHYFKLKNI